MLDMMRGLQTKWQAMKIFSLDDGYRLSSYHLLFDLVACSAQMTRRMSSHVRLSPHDWLATRMLGVGSSGLKMHAFVTETEPELTSRAIDRQTSTSIPRCHLRPWRFATEPSVPRGRLNESSPRHRVSKTSLKRACSGVSDRTIVT